ncbi:hypothetical protein [Nocardioides sp. LHG3406-4]|uniref:hypothetical protein n=1 Tax=Nocardioides sp. LHG3406-4 TaxID=2804575 RepID=UPI003CEB61B6
MRYSVVGAATLGFDLTRLEHGTRVAGVLRAALACGPEELEQLAAAHPGPQARRARQAELQTALFEREALADLLPQAGRAFEESLGGSSPTLRRLEAGLLGDPAGIDHLVRHDILDWTWLRSGSTSVQDPVAADAADVLSDAAVAAYLRSSTRPDLWSEMSAPLESSGIEPVESLLIAGVPTVSAMLQELALADDELLARWRRVVADVRGRTAQWAPAMHRTSWALSLAERLRLAADVQLAGVIAFSRSGLTASDAAYGAWNALTGVLQAQLVSDLLPDVDADVLMRPWRQVRAE